MSLASKAISSGIARVFTLPRLSLPLILTLGLTLGAVLSVIAIASSLLVQPLQGVPNEKRIQSYSIETIIDDSTFSFLDMKRLAHFNDDFADIGQWAGLSTKKAKVSFNNTHYEVNKNSASSNILKVLGTNLIKGQDITIASPERFVWISESFWQSAFSGSESALGQTVKLDDKSYSIVGIIEDVSAIKSSGIINLNQIWQITNLAEIKGTAEAESPLGSDFNILVLMKNSTNILTSEEIEKWGKKYATTNFNAEATRLFKLVNKDSQFESSNQSYRDHLLGSARSLITTLMITVIALLLMAVLNLLNLFIAHYQARSKEFAIQLSLGASLGKLRLLIFLENIPCFALAAITGLLSAGWIIKTLPVLASNNLPLLNSISLNIPTLISAVVIVMLLTLIFSLLATIDVNRHNLIDNLNSSGKGLQAQSNQTLSKSLMVFQLSLTSILLTSSAMLAVQSYQEAYSDLGYSLGNSYAVSMTTINMDFSKKKTDRNEILRMINFIESTASDSTVIVPDYGPLDGVLSSRSFKDEENNISFKYGYSYVNENYFPAFNIDFIAGKNISKEQMVNNAPVAIIDARMAKLIYPNLSYEEIIGREFKASKSEILNIQGIVPTLRRYPGDLASAAKPTIYGNKFDYLYYYFRTYTVMMPDGKKLTTAMLEDKFKQQFPLLENLRVRSLNENWSEMTKTHRVSFWITLTITLLTLFLATLGVSGLTQMTTSHRKYELAVRMATGAKQSLLVKFMLKDALWMLVIGLGLGFSISVLGYQQLKNNFIMLPEFNGLAMSILDMGLIVIVLFSVIIPAWRVISSDPMQALREE